MKLSNRDWQRLEVAHTALEGVTDVIEQAQQEEAIEIHNLRSMLKLLNKAETQLRILAGDDVSDV